MHRILELNFIRGLFVDGIKTNSLTGCSKGPLSYRSFALTWSAAMQISWNKRRFLHEQRFQSSQDFLGTLTWPLFHCFGTPIWPP